MEPAGTAAGAGTTAAATAEEPRSSVGDSGRTDVVDIDVVAAAATAAGNSRSLLPTLDSSRLLSFGGRSPASSASSTLETSVNASKLVAGWFGAGLGSTSSSSSSSSNPSAVTSVLLPPIKKKLKAQGPSAPRLVGAPSRKINSTDAREIPALVRRKSLKRAHRTPVPNIKPIISITPVPSPSPVHTSSPLSFASDGAWDLSNNAAGVCVKMPSTGGPLDLQSRTKVAPSGGDVRGSSPCQDAPIALTKKSSDVLDLVTNGKVQTECGNSSDNDSRSCDGSGRSIGSEMSDVSSKNDYVSEGELSRRESKMDSRLADHNAYRLLSRKPGFQQLHQSLNPLNNLELMSSIALALDMSSSVTVTPVQSAPSPPMNSPLNLSLKRGTTTTNDYIAVTPATAHASSSSASLVSTVSRGAKRGPKPRQPRSLSAYVDEENQLLLRQEELKSQLELRLRQQQHFQLKLTQKKSLFDRHASSSPAEILIQTADSGHGSKHCSSGAGAGAVTTAAARNVPDASTKQLSSNLLALSKGLSARAVSLLPPESVLPYYSASRYASSSNDFGRFNKSANGALSLIPIESPSAEMGSKKKGCSSKSASAVDSKANSDDDDSSNAAASSGDSIGSSTSASGSFGDDSESSSDTETSSGRGQKRGYSSEGSSPAKKSRQLVISEERELRIPLEHGWRRLTKIRMYSFSGARGEVVYFAPCGKKLKTYPEVVRYLEKNGINDIGRENFSFSAKHNVGEYLEPQGNGEYAEIGEAEVTARIEEFRARKGRRYIPVAMRRKLEEKHRKRQESRQRKRLEQQGIQVVVARQRGRAKAAAAGKKRVREKAPLAVIQARKSKAAEVRLQKEHDRFVRQQEKFEKQEQLRLEREVKAQHAQEARKKRQELLEKQRMEETEREMKRLQAVVLREQELQKRREMLIMVDLERERRRQHMLLVKALETRKRQEERERMKEERLEEKKLIRERKMEERRLEMHLIREMRKPVDDMELKDSKPLPVLNRIPGVKLAGQAFADLLMVYEFLHNFGDTLGFDMNGLPSLNTLQSGLLADSSYEEEILSVLYHLLTCLIEDPGVPSGSKGKTALGQHLRDVDITPITVSEVLRIYIAATEGSGCKYVEWLNDKPFMSLTPTQKSSILAHLCNELLSSRVLCRHIDNNIEMINNMRRDKWMVEGKVRKLKLVHAKRLARQQYRGTFTGYKPLSEDCGATPSKKLESNADEDIQNNNSDNEQSDGSHDTGQPEVEEPEEEPGLTIEDLGKKIEKMTKQQNLCRRKLIRATQQLRVSSLGQDRYRRRYWILPTSGGVFVEGLESSELPDDNVTADEPVEADSKSENHVTTVVKEEMKDEAESKMEVVTESAEIENNEPEEKDSERKDKVNETEAVAVESVAVDVDINVKAADEQKSVEEKPSSSEVPAELPAAEVQASTPVTSAGSDKLNASNVPVPALNLSSIFKNEGTEGPEGSGELNGSIFGDVIAGTTSAPTSSSAALATSTTSTFNQYYYTGLFPVPQCQISAEQILKSFGQKAPEEKLWFSILPRMPCDETSLTRLKPTDDLTSSVAEVQKDTKSTPVLRKPIKLAAATATATTSSSTPNSCSVPPVYQPFQFSPYYFQSGSGSGASAVAQMSVLNGSLSSSITPSSFLMHSNLCGNGNDASKSMDVTKSSCSGNNGAETPISGNNPSPYGWSPVLMQQYAALRDLQQQQYSVPRPVPGPLRRGWWRISDVGQLKAVHQVLHSRGIREKMMQVKLQKYLDVVVGDACSKGGQLCASLVNEEVDMESSHESEEAPKADDDSAWNRDIMRRLEVAVLEQVETLEDKVANASMQLKQWKLPPKITEIEDVRFHVMGEEVPATSASEPLHDDGTSSIKKEKEEEEEEEEEEKMTSPPDKVDSYSALGTAKERLLSLEAAIERRYMKPPLGHSQSDASFSAMTSHHGRPSNQNSNSGSGGADNRVLNVDGDTLPDDGDEDDSLPPPFVEEVSKSLLAWRIAVRNARSCAQLAVCLNYLESSIAWDRSIMKASCQFCNSGDNEAMLLLCDGCDKGYHTYCFKPKMESIPDGDWFCYECLNKATGNRLCLFCGKKGKNLCLCDACPKAFHTDCLDPPLARVPKTKWHCPQCNNNNNNNNSNAGGGGGSGSKTSAGKCGKVTKARRNAKDNKKDPVDSGSEDGPKNVDERLTKTERPTKDRNKNQEQAAVANVAGESSEDMAPCKEILSELQRNADAWPFLLPVNTKQFPSYKRVIRRPMDMSTINGKLENNAYRTRAEFASDVRLVFDNCETFNEDDSPVGKAGHNLRAHFECRWHDVGGDK